MTERKWSLAACRVNAKLTQKEAAGILKMSPATLNAHETGKISPKMDQNTMFKQF